MFNSYSHYFILNYIIKDDMLLPMRKCNNNCNRNNGQKSHKPMEGNYCTVGEWVVHTKFMPERPAIMTSHDDIWFFNNYLCFSVMVWISFGTKKSG